MRNDMDRVVPLDRLDDFEIADGDPDVRGWDVISADGRKVGEVDQLLVDTAAMKVRYLDVDLDDALLEAGRDRHVLVPIGYAVLDRDGGSIRVNGMQAAECAALPEYRREAVTTDYETSVTDAWKGREATGDQARMTLSEEELTLRTRERSAGEVEVEKHVETRHVRESVPVSHEEVVVERRPADPMRATGRIEEAELRVPLSEEEVVAEKRTVPKEELVVRKREVIENETVEADLRKERAEVHREGNVRRER